MDPNCLPGGIDLSTNNQPLSKDNPVHVGVLPATVRNGRGPPRPRGDDHGYQGERVKVGGPASRPSGETCGVDYAAADFGPDVVLYVFKLV